ncbi:MAG: hypothetical protein JNJ73_04145 [Hyphomonadaceae bacterium]|nr:hypothetical protein [Hyphomonadaceae bacterium]
MAWKQHLTPSDQDNLRNNRRISAQAARMALEQLLIKSIRLKLPHHERENFDRSWRSFAIARRRSPGMAEKIITVEDYLIGLLAPLDRAVGGPVHAFGDWMDDTAEKILSVVRARFPD